MCKNASKDEAIKVVSRVNKGSNVPVILSPLCNLYVNKLKPYLPLP